MQPHDKLFTPGPVEVSAKTLAACERSGLCEMPSMNLRFAATIERGQQNMAQLEQAVIKDNTLLPGEWYGGQLHLAPPTDQGGGPKTYSIVITVGSDRHVVEVAQGPAGS